MNDQPLVTVLLPVFNAESFLKKALQSISNQSYQNLEILAIDDGSTDNSPSLLAKYEDKRLRIETNEKNLGLIGTLNKGVPLSLGKYIVRADADDICLPERIAKQVHFMETNPGVGISGTGFGTFGENLSLTEKGHFSSDHFEIRFRHLYQIHLLHGTSIWRKDALIESGMTFDPDFAHAEDYDLFDRMDQVTKLSNIPDVLYHVRMHDQSVSKQFDQVQEANSIRIKKRAFARLGLKMTDNRLDLFRNLCHLDYRKLNGEELAVASLILEMETANKDSNYFPIDFLRRRLQDLWLRLYLNNASSNLKKQLDKHPIHNLFSLGLKNELKIWIKSILK
jgi:glycosyltransferase involved in cell wall biosynthesis